MDPWDIIDALEEHSSKVGFRTRWREFMRACATDVLPRLSHNEQVEAQRWIAAADAYERGLTDEATLSQTRSSAWRFHDSRRNTVSQAELDALRTVMYRMWPDSGPGDWHIEASHFVEFCEGAGLPSDEWARLLRHHFRDLVVDPVIPPFGHPDPAA